MSKNDSLIYEEEVEDFGEDIGCIPIYQLTRSAFNDACNSKLNARAEVIGSDDSTGKRLYSGTYVVLRFFYRIRQLLKGKQVVEIGCGTGIVGAILNRTAEVAHLVLTDGNTNTLEITRQNIKRLCSEVAYAPSIHVVPLFWPATVHDSTSIDPQIAQLFHAFANNAPFDIVLGSELMYYTTDIAQLFSTFRQLIGHQTQGIFLHGHVFRRDGQIDEWISITAAYDYVTMEVLPTSLLTATELRHHPEWYKVRVLVTAHVTVLPGLLQSITEVDSLSGSPQSSTCKPLRLVPLQEIQVDEEELAELEGSNNEWNLFR